MNVIRFTDSNFDDQLRDLAAASSLFDTAIEGRTRSILDAVHAHGDAALIELTERFDGATLSAGQLSISKAELLRASLQADEDLRSAMAFARKNIEFFSRKSLRKNWSARNAQGAKVGEKYDAYQRVGIYVPGGTAPLVSTARRNCLIEQSANSPGRAGSPRLPSPIPSLPPGGWPTMHEPLAWRHRARRSGS